MTTQETITKLIEKYEAQLADLKFVREHSHDLINGYLDGKIESTDKFLTDLKELQNTINN